MIWHLITSEYPPQPGGVSDYTCQLAGGLAALGNEVYVWCPPASDRPEKSSGITIQDKLGKIGIADLRSLGRELNRFPGPRRVLVQWVPHGYRFRSMNLAFCFWLWSRSARHKDAVEIMVHEPFLAFGEGSWRQNIPALVHRLMTIVLLRAAGRVWVSIPEWERRWKPYTLGRPVPFQWLPIPSNIPVVDDNAGVQAVRRRYTAQGNLLIGHFGTYGSPIASVLEPVLLALGEDFARWPVLLMGIGSEAFRKSLLQKKPELVSQVQATGALTPEDLSRHIAACDLLIQPYPDGVSSRRTSFMVGLSHGKPILTTSGHTSETFWSATEAVSLAPAGDAGVFVRLLKELCADESKRARMGDLARKLYRERFDISHTIAAFHQADEQEPACAF